MDFICLKKRAEHLMTGFKMKIGDILLENVTKTYNLRRGIFFRNKKTFTALNDFSLKINSGDRLGIIGNNGSGKTTLLKIISGITEVTSGEVATKGKIVSLLELSAGFHPDISGFDNIMLNGLLTGLSRREVAKRTNKIILDSGISDFVKMPFYTYSSGMKLKLAFSVAINSDPDILIFDEIVSAGDEFFIKMFMDYFNKIIKEKKTLIFASHILEVISLYCNKVLWMEHGSIRMVDETAKVIREYKKIRSNI